MTVLTNYEKDIAGSFEDLDPKYKEEFDLVVCNFMLRDGFRHPDGSLGTMTISPRQFMDCIAWASQRTDGSKEKAK